MREKRHIGSDHYVALLFYLFALSSFPFSHLTEIEQLFSWKSKPGKCQKALYFSEALRTHCEFKLRFQREDVKTRVEECDCDKHTVFSGFWLKVTFLKNTLGFYTRREILPAQLEEFDTSNKYTNCEVCKHTVLTRDGRLWHLGCLPSRGSGRADPAAKSSHTRRTSLGEIAL